MDAESLVQIERIVTTAVSGAEGSLRKEMAALGSSLRQESETMAASLRQELGGKLTEKFGEAERHSGVLHEDVLRRLDLVIEGFEGLRQGQTALRQMIEHESLEVQSLIKLSYRQLQERVETLEQRVQIIEKRLGLSN